MRPALPHSGALPGCATLRTGDFLWFHGLFGKGGKAQKRNVRSGTRRNVLESPTGIATGVAASFRPGGES